MKQLSIDYQSCETLEAARLAAGLGYTDELLLSDSPRKPFQVGEANIVARSSGNGHCIAALGVAAADRKDHRKPLVVIDFGGGLGGNYALANSTFRGAIAFDWTVFELRHYVEYARRFVVCDALSFTENVAELPARADIAHFSGVLQYLPLAEALRPEVLREAPYVFITRTAMGHFERPYLQTVVYDTHTSRLPGRIIPRTEIDARMTELGYQLHTSWADDQWVLGASYSAPAMLWALPK